jgi:hypothetical protein
MKGVDGNWLGVAPLVTNPQSYKNGVKAFLPYIDLYFLLLSQSKPYDGSSEKKF